MGELARIGDIEIAEDMKYQRIWWKVQKVAAVAMGAILVAALLGVFHDGPLSDTTAGGEGAGIAVHYERFLRAQAPAELRLRVLDGEGRTEIALARSYVSEFRISGIEPQPDSVAAQPDRFVYRFDQSPPSEVTFFLEPERMGVHDARVWGPGERRVEFTQVVYP